jgi:hypothetical protein
MTLLVSNSRDSSVDDADIESFHSLLNISYLCSTALLHFFTIHDAVLYPMINFLSWKSKLGSGRLGLFSNKRSLAVVANQEQPDDTTTNKKLRIPPSLKAASS